MNKLLELDFCREINCSRETVLWNYWDHEHLTEMHDGYVSSDIMYEKGNVLFRIDNIKFSMIPFLSSKTPIFMAQHDENTIVVFAIQYSVISKTTIKVEALEKYKTKIYMNYKFYLNGWRILLKPILKKFIERWNNRVWIEDLEIKQRRDKFIRLGFKDFSGMPSKISDRKPPNNIKFKLPVARPKNSIRDRHTLRHTN